MKRILLILAGVLGLLVIAALVVPFLVPKEVYKAQIEKAATADLEPILVAGDRLATWLSNLPGLQLREDQRDKYVGDVTDTVPGVTGGIMGAWEGPWGKFVIGGTGPNTYEGDDFIGIIDLGGDDTYKGRVAWGIGLVLCYNIRDAR